jgi:hypothetical protein
MQSKAFSGDAWDGGISGSMNLAAQVTFLEQLVRTVAQCVEILPILPRGDRTSNSSVGKHDALANHRRQLGRFGQIAPRIVVRFDDFARLTSPKAV